ncbi:MAG: alpha-amylase family protein [Pigmentiphaga sp.]|uniref:alpha-amylase family protein n=1 Tax=Pigmentiphaga sp. TaxID=1977564 RepID=UPI0029A17F9A|nr:alpha-amylase family protein [Pigmentiphaga sp.]MDX3904268.1 alpha-amylase family protein [Pigmentiphaga sp.]
MLPLWYRNAIIYQVDPSLFRDANGDGRGDLQGITNRLEYLRGLGVTCLWLMPFYTSPFHDWGYDVADHLSVDPRFGALPDVVTLLEKAEELGLRVIVDLVVQHTSDRHPWFQAARSDRNSRYRDYFIWADKPEPTEVKPIFPTVEDSVWTWDEKAGQYYRHVFYSHEPDLNLGNPEVRVEIERIMDFWLRLGVSGFRVDAASHMIESAKQGDPTDGGFWLLNQMRRFVSRRRADAVLLGEVDVPPAEYAQYFGQGDRLTLVLNFWLNNYLYLSLVRQSAEPLARALAEQPVPPETAQYALWLRNHDELDLERLSESEREEVMACFAPDPEMRIYNRGIRRRLPPMLGGDPRKLALVHAVLFSLPGTPILRYGEEIGMGDDLSLPERLAVRTAMQWSDEHNAGFSTADPDKLAVPLIRTGPYGYPKINVYAQSLHDDSLLTKTGKMIRARLGLHEIGSGRCRAADVNCPQVLALRHELDGVAVVTFANLGPDDVEFEIHDEDCQHMTDVMADGPYDPPEGHPAHIRLRGYGYRWLRPRDKL